MRMHAKHLKLQYIYTAHEKIEEEEVLVFCTSAFHLDAMVACNIRVIVGQFPFAVEPRCTQMMKIR